MKQNVGDFSFEYKLKRRRAFSRVALTVILVFLFISVFCGGVMTLVSVHNSSMEGSIARDGVVLICPIFSSPARGQVVRLSRLDDEKLSVGQSLANIIVSFFTLQKVCLFGSSSRTSGKDLLRRVVVLPGETFYMKDYILYIRPKGEKYFLTEFELSANPYTISVFSVPVEWDGLGCVGEIPETTLGKDEYFVLADNRVEGLDSRVFGSVPLSKIRGRAIFQCYPFRKASRI